MAKKTEPSVEIVPVASGVNTLMANLPDFLKEADTRGTEHLTKDDITMPRIGLAQAQSPELEESDPKFIHGLTKSDMFNTLTQQIYGRGPVYFTIVRADAPRYIEFKPMEQGGGIVDPNVAPNDPRTQFGPNGEPPIATKFYDYIIMLLPTMEPVALSLKGSNLKVAKQLNALIKLRNRAIFAGRYELTTAMTKNDKGTFAVFNIRNAGWITEEAQYRQAEAFYNTIKDKQVIIEHDDLPEVIEDASFNPDEM